MGGQHKKNLRAEKAKVKLKGNKLPKGLNVTKTDFKVGKIIIREQLKESVSMINGQPQLNLSETLSRLKHHNQKFRTAALHHVRNAIKAGHAEHFVGRLSELLQGIAAGCLDVEREVRQESCKTLDALLDGMPATAIDPFFNILVTYLRCAMTHLQPKIQEDSLLMLDVLLQRVPATMLAERGASAIIGNFIAMISRRRHDTQQANRLLTVRMGQGLGDQTTIKWRTKVLLRLQQMLATLLLPEHSKSSTAAGGTRATGAVLHFDMETPQYYHVLGACAKPDRRPLQLVLSEHHGKSPDVQLRQIVQDLMPLLYDNWLEVRPQQQQQQQQQQQEKQLLSVDAAESLHVLLDIMRQLWQLVQQHESQLHDHNQELSSWMRSNFAANFQYNFFVDMGFPYERVPLTQSAEGKRSKKRKLTAGGDLCIAQNLSLVQLYCHFCPHPGKQHQDDYGMILQYLQQCVRQLSQLPPEEQLRLVAALRAVLLENGAALLQLELQLHKLGCLMLGCIAAYVEQQFATRDGVATRMLHMLCEIVQQRQLYAGYGGEDQFLGLLGHLPQLLLKPTVSSATLQAMSTLCRQNTAVFLKSLAAHAPQIVQQLDKLQVSGTPDGTGIHQLEHHSRILNFLYYARPHAKDVHQWQATLERLRPDLPPQLADKLQSVLAIP